MLTDAEMERLVARERNEGAVVVEPVAISVRGEIGAADPAAAAAADHARVVARVRLAGGAPVVVASLPAPGPRAQRILSELGVLDVTAHGLRVREVARGVSARDIQRRLAVELSVGPDLRSIDLD